MAYATRYQWKRREHELFVAAAERHPTLYQLRQDPAANRHAILQIVVQLPAQLKRRMFEAIGQYLRHQREEWARADRLIVALHNPGLLPYLHFLTNQTYPPDFS